MLTKMQCPVCLHGTIVPVKVSFGAPGLILEIKAEGAGGIGAVATNHLPKMLNAKPKSSYVWLEDKVKNTRDFRGVAILTDYQPLEPNELGDEPRKCACCGHTTLIQNTKDTKAMWTIAMGMEGQDEAARLQNAMPEGVTLRVEGTVKKIILTPTSAGAPRTNVLALEELRELAVMAGVSVDDDATEGQIRTALEEKRQQLAKKKNGAAAVK